MQNLFILCVTTIVLNSYLKKKRLFLLVIDVSIFFMIF